SDLCRRRGRATRPGPACSCDGALWRGSERTRGTSCRDPRSGQAAVDRTATWRSVGRRWEMAVRSRQPSPARTDSIECTGEGILLSGPRIAFHRIRFISRIGIRSGSEKSIRSDAVAIGVPKVFLAKRDTPGTTAVYGRRFAVLENAADIG